MRKIRIISIPSGEAPEWVRKAWRGLEIPIVKENPEGAWSTGVLTGKIYTIGGYWVQGDTVLKLLKEKNPKAFQWWLELYSKQKDGFSPMRLFLFDKDCCEVVE